MNEQQHFAQVRWRSRRGMLELDLLLLPFVDHHFLQLTEKEKCLYEALLQEPDPEIYNWLMGYSQPESEELRLIVHLIQSTSSVMPAEPR